MKRYIWLLPVAVALLVGACTVDQADQIEKALSDANSVAGGLTEFVSGPAGAVFPPIVRTIAEVLGVSLAVALGLWQRIRHNLTGASLSAVTAGIEKLADTEQKKAKTLIAEQMKATANVQRGLTYAKLNAEVDKAKA